MESKIGSISINIVMRRGKRMTMSSDKLYTSRQNQRLLTTYHAKGLALLGSPIHMGISSFDDFHGAKIIVSADFLLMCGVKRLGTKYVRKVHLAYILHEKMMANRHHN
jgi:hypothetical protein